MKVNTEPETNPLASHQIARNRGAKTQDDSARVQQQSRVAEVRHYARADESIAQELMVDQRIWMRRQTHLV